VTDQTVDVTDPEEVTVLSAADLFKMDPLLVQTPSQGQVALRWLSCASAERLERLRSGTAGDDEFMRRALYDHLSEPQVSLDEFREWPAEDLLVLARAWASWESGLHRALPLTEVGQAFALAFDEYSAESRANFERAWAEVASGMEARDAVMRSAMVSLAGPNLSLLSSFKEERLSLTGLRESLQMAEEQRAALPDPALRSMQLLSGLQSAFEASIRFGPSIGDFASMASGIRGAAEYTIALNAAIEAQARPPAALLDITNGLEVLSGAAERAIREKAMTSGILQPSTAWLYEAPALELYSASRSALSFVQRPVESAPQAAKRLEVVAGSVSQLLVELQPDLLPVYHGAVAALARADPDYPRHFASSCRELLSHVLRRLAPDEAVIAWAGGAWPDGFDEQGRPTRRLRARFILRYVASTAYAEFVENDVAQVVQLIAFLNGPAHRVEADEDRDVLRLIMRRVEGCLALLLEANRLFNA
jgi:Predicted pPIWI-associating nuclease